MDTVVLYNELQELLTRAVCDWAGVPLPETAVRRRTREVTALFDYAGAVGPKHLWSRLARKRTDRWMADIICRIRFGQPQPSNQSLAQVLAWHRGLNGELLSPQVAAVELCNLIRPTVAIAVYITFIAHALHQHPEHRQKLESDDKSYGEWFVQEVRRFYPFFPALAARVRKDFEWRGYQFDQGRLVVLDLYGTNHDARTWEASEEFWPERFRHWDGSPFNFIPQGGGDHNVTHRCAGEWITIALMKVALDFLTRRITYDVPGQDLGIAWSRLPAIPHSRFIIRNVAIAPSA